MLNKVYITGDCHGIFDKFDRVSNTEDTALIILGDAGFNFFLNDTDVKNKNKLLNKYKFKIYCVKGNHEARPETIKYMIEEYDEDVQGDVYYQPRWPNIRYFKLWGVYCLKGYTAAIIGGAYSVDKWHRLNKLDEKYNIPLITKWWNDEQLSEEERRECFDFISNYKVDFVFTHTCPLKWEPSDLFLEGIDQSRVDKSTEIFLDKIEENIDYKYWLFGHYHKDRYERKNVQQMCRDVIEIDDIIKQHEKLSEDTFRVDTSVDLSSNIV